MGLFDLFKTPQVIERTPSEQQAVVDATAHMSLYYYEVCPFCIRVLRELQRLNLPIERRDILHNAEHRQALVEGGRSGQVPCLRIDEADGTTWMYESADIIAFLKAQFG